MKYIQTDIQIEKNQIEPLTGLLLEEGISDTVVSDPDDLGELLNKKEEYEWDYIAPQVLDLGEMSPKITFYLEDDASNRCKLREISDKIQIMFPNAHIEISTEDDSSWKDQWKKYFKPAHITDKLTVKPTWEQYTPHGEEKIIEIDPGMAFGTGTHETTSLCLKLMEEYMGDGRKVLDIGCGSGILSIGAALLGAEEVLAVDIDPQAVEVSKENVALNRCEDKIKVQVGNLADGIDFKADIVVANLMADLVMTLSGHVESVLQPGGIYISSGILTEKENQVAEAITENGFEIEKIKEDGMWCAIAARLPKEKI